MRFTTRCTPSTRRKSGAYAIDVEAPAGTSVEAAVAAAAHGSLVRLAPAERPTLDAALNVSLSKIADGQGKSDGTMLGQQIAEKIVALCSADGAAAKIAFTAKSGIGLYQLTPPQSLPAILAQWGSVTPFVLRGRTGLDFKGAPAVTTAQFARDFDEVRSVGARNSTTRTADQTAAAIFWTVQTAVPWHAAARAASAAKGLSLSENARLFALLSMASADSQIIAFDGKIQPAALAADHGHPRRNGPEYCGAQGRYRLGAASGDTAASRVPFRPCDVFRCRGSCPARLLRQ